MMEKALTEQQKAAAQVLALGSSAAQAARTAGVSERTISRWRKKEAFENEINRVADSAVADSLTAWKALQRIAVQTAFRLINDASTPAAVKAQLVKIIAERLPDFDPDRGQSNVLLISLDTSQRKLLESQFGTLENAQVQIGRMLTESVEAHELPPSSSQNVG